MKCDTSHDKPQLWLFCWTGIFLLLVSTIPLRLAIAAYQAPQPQAILTLGRGSDREKFTAEFARTHPVPIWVSSGIPPAQFRAAGIPDKRVHLDRRAVDTVTNFTSLVEDFEHQHIQHLYLITSDFHMPRATAIATLVLGSQGITFTPISIPTNHPPEAWLHILRDCGRSIVWIVTGRTGASFSPNLQPHAPRSLYPWHLHPRRSPLETSFLVLFRGSAGPELLATFFWPESSNSPKLRRPNWSAGAGQTRCASEVSLAAASGRPCLDW